MKTRKLYSMLVVLMLFAAGCFMYACTPDKETESISPLDLTQNTSETACTNCYENFILKGSGGQALNMGRLTVCERKIDGVDHLCFNYISYDGRTINSIDIGFYASPEEMIALTPSHNNFQKSYSSLGSEICIPLSEIAEFVNSFDLAGQTIYIATNIQMTGASGGNPGGQGWVGNLTLNGRYPFDRTFTFTFCPITNGGNGGCNKTQGFWKNHGPGVCSPGGQDNLWPESVLNDGLMLGNVTYTAAQLCTILNTPPGTGKKANGLITLAHQLIAAKLNVIAYGTTPPSGGTCGTIIECADALIGNLSLLNGGYITPTTASPLVMALTTFNETVCNVP
jgi:hypothetical protein